jgi:hypothetical protein
MAQTTAPSIQEPGAGSPIPVQPPRHYNPEASKRAKLTRLRKTLNLTPDQESKAKPLIDKYVNDTKSLREDLSLQPKEKRLKLAALRKQYNSELDTILSEEQRQKLATIKAERLAKLRAGRAAAKTKTETSPAPETTVQ